MALLTPETMTEGIRTMLNRREFIALTGAAVTATLIDSETSLMADGHEARDYYELRKYTFANGDQKAAFHKYLEKAAIPAYNRIGVRAVGAYDVKDHDVLIYVIIVHDSVESFATATEKLLADDKYVKKGKDTLNTDAKNPAYSRIETTFMKSFKSMPTFETPYKNKERVLELRNYQSHSVKAGQKKIEMFNVGEIDIMKNTTLGPVLYGEHLTGPDMPNLTYILSFPNMDAHPKSWRTFATDPAWKEISSKPEYANSAILSGISNLFLLPTEYSQI
jgi:hypothetical protein